MTETRIDTRPWRLALILEREGLLARLASLGRPEGDPTERADRDEVARVLGRSLHDVEDALARLQRGTFGRCEGCGRPIPPGRLRALPRARLCVACQRSADARHRASRIAHSWVS